MARRLVNGCWTRRECEQQYKDTNISAKNTAEEARLSWPEGKPIEPYNTSWHGDLNLQARFIHSKHIKRLYQSFMSLSS